MPRRSAAQVAQRRTAILDAAVGAASVEGLAGITIGNLASEIGISKSGLVRHFNHKEGLQLATLEKAIALFVREVWTPIESEPAGRRRLLALCDLWLSFFEREVLPGGCFMTTASVEFDARPGRVRDAIATVMRGWLNLLENEFATARLAGELDPQIRPRDAAFELNALAQGANCAYQLHRDRRVFEQARRAMHRLLASPA